MLLGVAIWLTKRHYFVMLMDHVRLIQSTLKPIFTMPNSIDSLCLQVAQVPRSRDMGIFVLTTTTTAMTIRPIILPLAHVRGVIV